MREIATLLISYGADVNAEHLSPLKGYTPLMLAAELDEKKIFDTMLVAGGDINKKYIDPRTGREISLLDIANNFNSKNVLLSLDDISTYAKFH
jgi:ankyrin repeat protein